MADPGRRGRALTSPPSLALFDIDGTLVASVGVDDECFAGAFREEFGISEIDTDWTRYPVCTDSAIVPAVLRGHLGREPTAGEIARHRERFVALLRRECRERPERLAEVPGARRLLARLRSSAGWAVAIATGGWSASSRLKLAAAGLAAIPPRVPTAPSDAPEAAGLGSVELPMATADDGLTREQIAGRAIERARHAAGVERFARIVLVADGPWDVLCARRLDLAFLGVGSGPAAERLRAAGAAQVIADYADSESALAALEVAEPPL